MNKTLLGILTLAIVPCMLSGFEIKELTVPKHILIPPSISEDGKSFVYTAIDGKTDKPAIFVSYLNPDGTFSKPVTAVTSEATAKGLKKHIISFQGQHGLWEPTQLRPEGGLNSPIIQGNIITFSATLENYKRGVFYARKWRDGKWRVTPIALQGQAVPDKKGVTFHNFDAPYITMNSEAIFLASLSDRADAVYKYKIPEEDSITHGKPVLLCKSNDKIFNFWDISVYRGNFALRAETTSGDIFIYVYDAKKKMLVRTSPDNYASLPKGATVVPLGPSLYKGRVAFSTYYRSHGKDSVYAIYSNVYDSFFAEPAAISGELIESVNSKFVKVGNPTLYIKGKRIYIVFMATLTEGFKTPGVYLAEINGDNVKISALAAPGQKLSNSKTVESAATGAVSIRDGIIPMAIKYDNGNNVIAYIRIY
ncbi:MAG: hypothetical protein GY750_08210 [Lentisphaerae bacterium]|nr:hypothetical protein [Lentisphaerota bacterium]MCP4101392.1 hypothetical protein [Lentisphaerota bacterium]